MRDDFRVEGYRNGDVFKVEQKDLHKSEFELAERVNAQAVDKNSHVYTCFYKSKPIAVIGGTQIYPGVMDLWSVTSPHVFKCPITFFKTVFRLIEIGRIDFNIHRYQMLIKSDILYLHKWAVKLKFKSEGILKQFGPDKSDYNIYARIF